MVIYDHWSYVTMLGTLEVLCTAGREGRQIDRPVFAVSPGEQAIWQVNCPLPVYLQMVIEDEDRGSFRYHGSATKQLGPTGLGLVDIQFSDAGAQRAAVESEDFGSPVFATHFPIGLLKYPHNVVAFNRFQRFLRGR